MNAAFSLDVLEKTPYVTAATPFNFPTDPKKYGVRWMYDRCLRDLLAHLHERQVLMRVFDQNIREGNPRDFLPSEYCKNYHDMDKMIVEKHQGTSLKEAKSLLAKTHQEMLSLAYTFSDDEQFSRGVYKCTYTTSVAAYFQSVTTSSYSQTVKQLKTHQKNLNT